jgi:hydroxypyruvate isomerase
MNRRTFLTSAGVAALAMNFAGETKPASAAAHTFKLKYAPHFGMFEKHAPGGELDELRFMAGEGFFALEDNGMPGKAVELQEAIAKEMTRLGIEMGVFVADADFKNKTFVSNKPEDRERIVSAMKNAVEVAKRVNAKWCTVVPGVFDTKLEWDYQTANCIENLKHAAGVCEPHGLIMVLEPLNPWRDHPGLFLTKIPQAYQICRAVGSPSCKILDDLYHQQITEGNLIPNIDLAWDEIAYFQIGDNPGRKEPTTGEINYRNVFKHIHAKGFTGIMGMEHGNAKPGKDGERALIEAYRWSDDFDSGLW